MDVQPRVRELHLRQDYLPALIEKTENPRKRKCFSAKKIASQKKLTIDFCS